MKSLLEKVYYELSKYLTDKDLSRLSIYDYSNIYIQWDPDDLEDYIEEQCDPGPQENDFVIQYRENEKFIYFND
jgi:hypothetical protein